MKGYIFARIGQAVLVLWLTYTAVFVFINLLPSDQIEILFDPAENLSPETAAMIRAYYGLDRPLIVQYFDQLSHAVRGDLGFSVSTGLPVIQRIASVAGNTMVLASAALTFAVVIALVITYLSSTTRSVRLKGGLRAIPELFSSIPTFWLGLVALHLFSIKLGIISLFPDGSITSLVIAALVLSIPVSAPITQVLCASVENASREGYVTVARAKGLGKSAVLLRHIVKNAAGPGITVVGLSIGSLFAGSVVTETVFGRVGLGGILLQAIGKQDVPLVQGMVVLTALIVVTVNLIVDLIYPLLDPRIATSRNASQKIGAF